MQAIRHKLVLIEDDARQQQLVASFLNNEGFEVITAERGDMATQLLEQHQPSALLLDLMLPGMDGIQVCQKVRSFFHGPILMLTAQNDDATEVSALNIGVDDFLSKPLRPHVLLARLRSALRRSEGVVQPNTLANPQIKQRIRCQDLTADQSQRCIWLGEQQLELTDAEFDLLYFFMDNAGHVLPRDLLFQKMRGIDYDGLDRSLDMRVSTIRKKLNDNTPPYRYIKSVRGKGYLFVQSL
ncbi:MULTISPECIES: response regulator transcription factor [Agarivorans]|uniref:DNA-binding response regulator n=1 Tax=Agarivorans gilvus TaxID=680279 RepID=A0ABQ1I141_9ALTE|nr:response regulator transcription factor [Agarivorans gilvus]GGB02061.1 DNA-binding response regulator [Agarivorans gilvus]